MTSLNVGVLGHVDSGKTTLTRRIAEIASTCAFDKHADSSKRRNTLDLGFSSLEIDSRRIALIDCPGHSQLIKAVLAASIVFDMAIVVIDASEGIQPQTAEHLLLCSLFCPRKVILVMNKIDLVDGEKLLENKKRVRKGLKAIGIDENSPMVEASLAEDGLRQEYVKNILEAMKSQFFEPVRYENDSFLMAVDHCFSIKGKGTVMTGTVLRGSLKLTQEFEIPYLQQKRRPKTLESWKQQVDEVKSGERAAMLVQNIDSDDFSRTIIAAPGSLKAVRTCLCRVNPIPFFRNSIRSGTKLHISIGFETLMAECQFLRADGSEYEQLDCMTSPCIVHLTFAKPIFASENVDNFLIASRLDQCGKGCRFAFHGSIQKVTELSPLRRFTRKKKEAIIERVENENSSICTGLIKKETNFEIFRNMKVVSESGAVGVLESPFGKSGKVRIRISGVKIDEKVTMYMKKYVDTSELISYVP